MRVNGGIWKGKPLLRPNKSPVRPTSDKMKEMLFNILGKRIEGAHFVDLFCGTGNLGIEALSRGAKFSSFIDLSSDSLKVAAANLEGVGADANNYSLHKSEALRWLRKKCPDNDKLIVFADPPYAAKVVNQIWQEMSSLIRLNKAIFVGLEYASESKLLLAQFGDSVDVRQSGNSSLAIMEK